MITRKQKGVKEGNTKYKGILEKIEIQKQNKELKKILLEKKILILEKDNSINDIQLFFFKGTLFYDDPHYNYRLNRDLLKYFFDPIREIDSLLKSILFRSVESKINTLFGNKSKLKYINKELGKFFKKGIKQEYFENFQQTVLKEAFSFNEILEYLFVRDNPDIITKFLCSNNFTYADYGINMLWYEQMIVYNEFYSHLSKTAEKYSSQPIHKIDPNYNIENINIGNNRHPLLFKNPYSCELYYYVLNKSVITTDVAYSYYYEIFKNDNHFIKKIEKNKYLGIINKVFDLKLLKVREDISRRKENKYINEIIKLRKCFDEEISRKI